VCACKLGELVAWLVVSKELGLTFLLHTTYK
jgi:hypothetical protein